MFLRCGFVLKFESQVHAVIAQPGALAEIYEQHDATLSAAEAGGRVGLAATIVRAIAKGLDKRTKENLWSTQKVFFLAVNFVRNMLSFASMVVSHPGLRTGLALERRRFERCCLRKRESGWPSVGWRSWKLWQLYNVSHSVFLVDVIF
jgi:hypothetical protein